MIGHKPARATATSQGLAALALWSLSVAISRPLSEALGPLQGLGMATMLGGLIALSASWIGGLSPMAMLRMGWPYLLVCGGLFTCHKVCFYAALGLSGDNSTALLVTLLNYLWPVEMVALSVPILGFRAKGRYLLIGSLLAVSGTVVALLCGRQDWHAVTFSGGLLPLILAAFGGLAWALYSNLSPRFRGQGQAAMPLFILSAGAALLLLSLRRHEQAAWTAKAGIEMLVLSIGGMAIAYSFWDRGVRLGNHRLLGVASYFMPIASLSVAAMYWWTCPGVNLAVGCLLVMAGAVVSKRSLPTPPP
jgi:drug/metabolite transporter (DMT)-like permease